ncbi:MAG TPA: hypothetical protein VM597_08740 [Gemmataceae bacterium]|nr:hypothetical protein [Gemmataceae bacterium]
MPTPTLPLLLAFVAGPVPAVTLPVEVSAQPGRLVRLQAQTDGKLVRWALASDDADLVPFPDGKVALFSSPKPGRYLVLAWTAAADVPSEAARCVVVVGGPPPPGPADPLAADLRRLFDADATKDRETHLAQLAAVYREVVTFADHPDVRTAAELAGRIRAAANSLLPADALVPLRKRVAEEIARHLPADGDRELTPATRKTAAELFDRVATALEAVR